VKPTLSVAEKYDRLDTLATLDPTMEDAVVWLVANDRELCRETLERWLAARKRVPEIAADFENLEIRRRAEQREYDLAIRRLGPDVVEYVE
jgi:hypothetical protein